MHRIRQAKIIATLGPSSSNQKVIEQLFQAGVDVFRLNLSHGTHTEHEARYQSIRKVEEKTGRPIGVMLDLQGPKLRVGTFANDGVILKENQVFTLDLDPSPGNNHRVQFPHPAIYPALQTGTQLLLDDGKIQLTVSNLTSSQIETEVTVGGPLSSHKGVNIPGVDLAISSLTPKDRQDIDFGMKLGVDWMALSFVQKPEDIQELRDLIGNKIKIIAKIEKPLALQHIQEIISLSDAIMVARGDLGVEMAPEEIPSLQKQIIRLCRKAGKPVIVATQMLDSMVKSPSPTRAEASDVATAIYDGADSVMLSAESASGLFPIEAVAMMDRIISKVERDPFYQTVTNASRESPESTTSDAITAAARQIAHTINSAAIVSFTTSGATALRAARERPECPVLALTSEQYIARQLSLVWGIYPIPIREISSFSEAVAYATQTAEQEGFAKVGDRIIVTAGVPFRVAGSTNIIRIARIKAHSNG